MADAPPTLSLSVRDARALALAAQGLPPRPAGRAGGGPASPATADLVPTLERTGFVRTLGGIEAYLALRARVPGMTRRDLDAALAEGSVQVVPAARGCIYLVARRHAPLCLRIAARLDEPRAAREHAKAGIKPGEIEKTAAAVLATLQEKDALTTDALRRELPAGAVRSLGEMGKKVGITSTLPPALRHLEFAGEIERATESGRLDTERYVWRVAAGRRPGGKRAGAASTDPAADQRALAAIFFEAAGWATARDFAAWAGVGIGEAKSVLPTADLVAAAVEGVDEAAFVSARHAALAGRRPGPGPADDAVALLPFEDNLVALRSSLAFLVDAAHHELEVPMWGSSKTERLGWAKHMMFRSVVAGGGIAGFWEFDPDSGEVVLGLLADPGAATRARIEAEAERTARFLREDLGHARSFHLDTEDELRKRAAAVRAIASRGARAARGVRGGSRAKTASAAHEVPAPSKARPSRAAAAKVARTTASRRVKPAVRGPRAR